MDLPDSLRGDGTLVSVIVPTYGDAAYLSTALESIAAQSHGNVEIVVVDSTGVQWLEQLAMEVDGLEYVFQDPRGLPAARNRGVEVASGSVVGFLDADDWWAPKKLEKQLHEIDAGADVVYSDAIIVDGDRRRRMTTLPIDDPADHWRRFLFEGGIPVPTVIARRACLEDEPFDERLDAVEDRNLLVRLFREYVPARVPEPLAYYTRRSGSMSSDAELIYENEQRSLEFLIERYPDLEPDREVLFAKAAYKYGKRLIRTGRAAESRRPICQAITGGYRTPKAFVVLSLSLLPCCNRRGLEVLEAIQERIRRAGS